MNKSLFVAVLAVGVMGAGCAAPEEPEEAAADEVASTSSEAEVMSSASALTTRERLQLLAVRVATVKYLDVNAALADGFVADPECTVMPDGVMGFHYVHPQRIQQPPDMMKPAILLYERGPGDSRRLTGVEYFMPVIVGGAPWFAASPPPPPPESNPAPTLFGQTFDGPMPGHNPQMPWHYDLHVWLWKYNPSGLFYHSNPRARCE